MTNNLKDLKQELKSFAKRVKDFKYTDSALITFLLTGMIGIGGVSTNLFSKENEIEAQTKAINTSIFDLKKDFKRARQENDKLLRNTNLELIQLMEQGDHVTKSPWSSWQYGVNGFYNNWHGRYKGRGDKSKKYPYNGIYERSADIYERSVSPDSGQYNLLSKNRKPNVALGSSEGFGIASFKRVKEPIIPFEVNASINPRKVLKEKISITAPTFTTPTAPETISFVPPTPQVSINARPPETPNTVSAPRTLNGPESYLIYKDSNGHWKWKAGGSPYEVSSGYNPDNRVQVALASEMNVDKVGSSKAKITYVANGTANNVEFENALLSSAGDTGTLTNGWPVNTTTPLTVNGFTGYALIKNTGNATINIKNVDIKYSGNGGSGTDSRWLFHTDAHNESGSNGAKSV